MDRRAFLRTATATVAATAFTGVLRAQTTAAPADPAAPAAKKRAIKKAVNLGMCKDGSSVLEKFQILKEAGFQGVELNRPDAIDLDDLLKAKEATGLEIAGIICSTHWGKPLSHPDEKVRQQGLHGLELALKDAGELGCKRLLLVPGVVNADVPYDVCWSRSIDAIKTAVPWAAAAKCSIAIENVWNQFIMSPLEAVRFVDEINSPWVGWHLDIGNVVAFGWPEQWIKILGKRVLNLHIKEFSNKKRDNVGMRKGFDVELGEGDVRWDAVMQALDAIDYQGFGIAEVPGGDSKRIQFLSTRMSELFAK